MNKVIFIQPVKLFSVIHKSDDIHEIKIDELNKMDDSKWKELGRKLLNDGNKLVGYFKSNDLAAIAVINDGDIVDIKEMPKYEGQGLKELLNKYCQGNEELID